MSQCAPCGRETPRWSVAEQVSPPASMAGEPAGSAMVLVFPPLSANAPSSGSVFFRDVAPKAQVVPVSRLWPLSVIIPEQLPAVLSASREFWIVIPEVGEALTPPPGNEDAVLPAMVLSVMLSVPREK